MKILIAYASVHGTTANCSRMLAEALATKGDVTMVDINKEPIPEPNGFDAVLLGSSIRFAKISKKLKRYIKEHIDTLNEKKCGVFLCCGIPDEFEAYAKEQTPKGFLAKLGTVYFGGELKPKQVKGIDKLLVSAMRKEITEHDFEDGNFKGVLPEILPENIKNFAECVTKALYDRNGEI